MRLQQQTQIPQTYDEWRERAGSARERRAIDLLEANDVPLPVVTIEGTRFVEEEGRMVVTMRVDTSEFRAGIERLLERMKEGGHVDFGPDEIMGYLPLDVEDGEAAS